MQNRKKQNKEIERQLKQRQKLTMAIFIAIAAIVALAVAWVIWDTQNRRWVMTFEGERVSAMELQFFGDMYNMPLFDEDSRNFLMEELRGTLAVIHRAEQHNVRLTADEIEELEMMAEWFGDGQLGTQRVVELMSSWSPWMGLGGQMRERLTDIYVPTYEPDPMEFAEEMQRYMDEQAFHYADMQVKYIVSQDMNALVEAWHRADEGEDFDELIRIFSLFYDEEEGITTLDAIELIEMYQIFDESEWRTIIDLQEGEFSRIVDGDGIHFIVLMYSREDNEQEARDSFHQQFVEQGRAIVFDELVREWASTANFTVNNRSLNSFN